MDEREYLSTAKIGKTHGLEGYVRIFSLSGETEHLLKLKEGRARLKDGRTVDVRIASVRLLDSDVLMKFDTFNTPEKARILSGGILQIRREDAPPLEEGEYYMADLFGLSIVSDGNIVGTVEGIGEGSQAPLLIVRKKDGKSFLLPLMEPFCDHPDFEKGSIELLEKDLLSL